LNAGLKARQQAGEEGVPEAFFERRRGKESMAKSSREHKNTPI
jgi:hypothetical protein